jgi:hypothetical protein
MKPKELFLDEMDLINGIKLCSDKAKRLLEDAKLLISNSGKINIVTRYLLLGNM